jgi:hypothetical protein
MLDALMAALGQRSNPSLIFYDFTLTTERRTKATRRSNIGRGRLLTADREWFRLRSGAAPCYPIMRCVSLPSNNHPKPLPTGISG